jgi:uncharacterized protein (DUF1499 family)
MMSKGVWLVVVLVLVGGVFLLLGRWLVARASPLSGELGVANGRLAPCPDSPNCVSSLATDERHRMGALGYAGETAVVQTAILAALNELPRITIVRDEPGYIHAEARSALWGFVDDVEFTFDEAAGLIHFRSAARLGYGDMGMNRARMEAIQTAYEAIP